MATTHSQSVMAGYTNLENAAAITTGHTDCVATPSGSEISNTDGQHAMKYRGIENLWGNTHTFCDGVSFSKEKMYVSCDPTLYEGGKTTGSYLYHGDRPTSSNWISQMGLSKRDSLITYATKASGADPYRYYCDYAWYWESGVSLCVGGCFNDNFAGGLWAWLGNIGLSYKGAGCRLCYKPI